jgi:hypothetical protein
VKGPVPRRSLHTRRVKRRQVALGLLLIALAGCGPSQETTPSSTATPEQETHSLVLTATGTAQVTSLTYTLDGRVVRTGPATLPWEETVAIPADGRKRKWALEAEFGPGDVTLVATVDGQLFSQSSGGGDGPNGNVSIDGDLTASR